MNISHIEQKHNTNHLSLQHIGNLAYNQGKRVTSYDSVHPLTNPNNHYTLLYPDLVQKLFDLSLHKNNIHTNISHSYSGLSEGIDKSSSLNISLRPQEILFFLQIVSLYQLELRKGNTSITYPSLKLAKLLGVDASCDAANVGSNVSNSDSLSNPTNSLDDANRRATILRMTAKLESLGLLKVFRSKRKNGMDLANKLIPILPDRLYENIKASPSNLKVCDSSKLDHESNLEHVLRTKLFVPIELEFMKSLFKNNLPSKYKLFFLNCIMSAYRNFKLNSNICFTQDSNSSNSRAGEDINSVFCDSRGNFIDLTNKLSFSATSSELVKKNNISKRTLFNIFKYIKQQGDSFFLQVEHKYTKSDDIDSNRYDKSIFVISINPLVFPISQIKSQKEEITEFDHDIFEDTNSSIFPDTYRGFREGVQKKQPSSAKKTALNNKDIIIKNIDYIDENCENLENLSISCSSSTLTSEQNYKGEFFEDKQGLSLSESYNNSFKSSIDAKPSCSNTTSESTARIIEDISEYKELRHFYPLSEQDVDTLNFRANREFSNNFVNQLLLKLYIKYPEKRFKNKFTLLSYMEKILANEKHQGPLVNHTSFRFSCNIGTIEKNLLEYEKYLNQIENSFDTSKEIQVRKKTAGRFNTNMAYEILTQAEFKTNHDNSFITVLVPHQLALSERQIATLSEQLEAVYGINGYYVTVVGDVKPEDVGYSEDGKWKGGRKEAIEKQYSKIKEPDIISNSEDIGILDNSQEFDTTNENTVWNQIRKGLREELGEAIDAVWFSKAVAAHCNDTKTLTLTMPTRFMSDWIRNNYLHVIRRLSGGCGVKGVEYRYE